MAEASPSVDAPAEVMVREWRTIDPSTTPALVGRYLDTPALRAQAEALRSRKALDVREVRAGLSIRAWQHVGVVQLGALRVVVRPKVSTDQLWRMIAYGLGIDGLPLDPPAAYALDGDFVDLLAAMLAHEAEGLWAGGLSSGYVERSAWLGSPRGRVDFAELARSTPLRRAALPCRHHAYTTDTLENRVVLAALVAARRGVRAPRLGRRLHQLAETYRTSCTEVHLDRDLLDRADRGRTRLTARYARAHRLARAIASGLGPDERLRAGAAELFGALWDMALLFERVVVRWLTETAPEGVRVASQVRLNGVFEVSEGGSDGPWRPGPVPRPDVVLWRREGRGERVIGVVDVKYREVEGGKVPTAWLAQMVLYAGGVAVLGTGERAGRSAPRAAAVPGGGRPVPAWIVCPAGERGPVAGRDFVVRAVVSGGERVEVRVVPVRIEAVLRGGGGGGGGSGGTFFGIIAPG